MSVVCFCSLKDLAAQTIKEHLLQHHPFVETGTTFNSTPIYKFNELSLVTIEQDSIYADDLDQQFTADLFIFASRHKSAAFKPALLTHIPGNWGPAELGGKASTLCTAHPTAMKIALQTLLAERQRLELTDWACGLEVTHHGPFIHNVPVLYIEIGSTEEEWQNPKAAEAVSQAVVSVAQRHQEPHPVVFGVGGPHYCPAFTRLCAETPYAISHILPKYYLDQASPALIKHAIERTSTPPSYVALDWKGMKGPQRDQVIQIVSELGLETKRVRALLHESEN